MWNAFCTCCRSQSSLAFDIIGLRFIVKWSWQKNAKCNYGYFLKGLSLLVHMAYHEENPWEVKEIYYEPILLILYYFVYDSCYKEGLYEDLEKSNVEYNLCDNEWLDGLHNGRHGCILVYLHIRSTNFRLGYLQHKEISMDIFIDG